MPRKPQAMADTPPSDATEQGKPHLRYDLPLRPPPSPSSSARPTNLRRTSTIRIASPAPDALLAPPSQASSSLLPNTPTRYPRVSNRRRSNTPSSNAPSRPKLGKKAATAPPGTSYASLHAGNGFGFLGLKPQVPRRAISARVARRSSILHDVRGRKRLSRSVSGTGRGNWERSLNSAVFPRPSRLGTPESRSLIWKRKGGLSGKGNKKNGANRERSSGKGRRAGAGAGVWRPPPAEHTVRRWETVARFVVEGLDSDSATEPELKTVEHKGVVVTGSGGDVGSASTSTAPILPSNTPASFSDKLRVRETLKQRRVQRLDTRKTTPKARTVDFQSRELPDTPGSVASTPRELYGGMEPGPRRLFQSKPDISIPTLEGGNYKQKQAPPRPKRPDVSFPHSWSGWAMGTINEHPASLPHDYRRVYIPGPIRPCDVGAIPLAIDRVYRKGSVATLEPFVDAVGEIRMASESRRASDDAALDDIISHFANFGAVMPESSGPGSLDRFWTSGSVAVANGVKGGREEGGYDIISAKVSPKALKTLGLGEEDLAAAEHGRPVLGHFRGTSDPRLTPGRGRVGGRARMKELLRFSR